MWPTVEAWRSTVPELLACAAARWGLTLGRVRVGGSASHVVSVRTAAGRDAVLKLSFPHREARDEASALRWWDGSGAVRLLEGDLDDPFVLLLERCDPGVRLADRHDLSPERRLSIAASALTRLWSRTASSDPGTTTMPVPSRPFERLADVTAEWADLVEERVRTLRPDLDLVAVARGNALLRELPVTAPRTVVVHGDYNPGNLLTATREPWLVIDPKPMVGDPAYDLGPMLMQINDPFALLDTEGHLRARISLLADMTGESPVRIAAWCVARLVESSLWYVSRSEPAAARDTIERAMVLDALVV
ncbi:MULTISPECIES: aminoglycoside phosphotransferase family protein [unclassified Curtobacterium]|nr:MULTISPECIES: aminoglycoside phosphotransferase family protein [unclassified Curtobacterium]